MNSTKIQVMLSAPIPSLISKFLGQQSSIMSSTMRDKQEIVTFLPGLLIDPDLPYFFGDPAPPVVLLAIPVFLIGLIDPFLVLSLSVLVDFFWMAGFLFFMQA